jgi:hypothetical protein
VYVWLYGGVFCETLARDRKCLLGRLQQFVAFHIIHNFVQLLINTREDCKVSVGTSSARNVNVVSISEGVKCLFFI